MTTKAEQDAAAQARAAELDQVRAAAKAEGEKEGETKGKADGTKAERDRVSAILGCEEAKGRGGLAAHLALHTETGVDEAKKLLAAAGKESGGHDFAAAMAAAANPKLGVDALDGHGDKPKLASASSIYATRAQSRTAAR